MRINQNMYYSDHLRILGQNRKKSMEKLSSGLAINRAGDNAAGFSIGMKMNAQVRGISQARRNIMDSQGLLEVAERGLQGVNDSLHRMRELSVQAANDVLTDTDRKEIQSEMDTLKRVISSTVKDTSLNTQTVLATEKPQMIHEVIRLKNKELGIFRKDAPYEQQQNHIKPYQKSSSLSQTISSVFELKTIDINSLEIVSTQEYTPKFVMIDEKQFIDDQGWINLPNDLPLYKLKDDSLSIRIYIDAETPVRLVNSDTDGYTISDDKIYFHGEAKSTDGYKLEYISNTFDMPDADLYVIGENKSVRIMINDNVVDDDYIYLVEKPLESVTKYISITENEMKLHGDWKLGLDDKVSVDYIKTGANTFKIDKYIDQYDSDQKALKVSVNNIEIPQFSEDNINYTYNSSDGTITLQGDQRIIFDSKVEQTAALKDLKIEYYKGTDEEIESTKVFFENTNLPEIYSLDDSGKSSIVVKRHVIDENGEITGTNDIGNSTVDGFSYNIGDKYITLHGNARPDTGDGISDYKYEISYAYELHGSAKQDGIYEIQLSSEAEKYIEYYFDGDHPRSIMVKKSGESESLDYLSDVSILSEVDVNSSGWYYNKVAKKSSLLEMLDLLLQKQLQ